METLYRKSTEKPNNEGIYNTSKGLLCYSKTFGWVTIENYTTSAPDYWFEEIPDNSYQIEKLEADKAELLEALEGIERLCDNQNPSHEVFWRISYSLLQKHKP